MSEKRAMIRGARVYMRDIEPADAPLYSRWRSDLAPMRTTGFGYRAPVGATAAEQLVKSILEAQGKPDWRFIFCSSTTTAHWARSS